MTSPSLGAGRRGRPAAPRSVRLPEPGTGLRWHRVIDTSLDAGEDFLDAGLEIRIDPPEFYFANSRSTVVLLGR